MGSYQKSDGMSNHNLLRFDNNDNARIGANSLWCLFVGGANNGIASTNKGGWTHMTATINGNNATLTANNKTYSNTMSFSNRQLTDLSQGTDVSIKNIIIKPL